MSEDKQKFSDKFKNDKKFRFEFFIGIWTGIVSVILLVGIIFVGKTFIFGNHSIDSEEAEEEIPPVVSETAVEPEETEAPYTSAIVSGNEEDFDEEEEDEEDDLKTAKTAYATTVVNVRSEPSLTATVITKLKTGEEVKILEYDKEWTKISIHGTEGYVSTIYLSTTKPEKEPVATAAPKKTAAPTPKPTKKPRATKKPKKTKRPVKTEKPVEKTPVPQPTAAPTEPPTPEPTKPPAPEPTNPPTASPQESPEGQTGSNTTTQNES